MYDILLVDDEPKAMKSLSYLLNWQQFGFQVKSEALNGKQALELLQNGSYSLMITDIKMPAMDGLQLISEVRKVSQMPIIILTGYGEFEYARQALKLGVEDYLMKPVVAEDLIEKLVKIREELELEALTSKRLYHGMTALKEGLIRSWVRGEMQSYEAFEQFQLQVTNWNQKVYCILMIEIESHRGEPEKEIRLRRFATRNVIEEACQDSGFVYDESERRIGIVYCQDKADLSGTEIQRFASRLRELIFQFAKVQTTVFIGNMMDEFRDVVLSYSSVKMLIDKQNLTGNENKIVSYEDLFTGKDEQHIQLVEKVKMILSDQCGEYVNLKWLAQQVYITPGYLGQIFKVIEGVSFNDYLIRIRMEKAKKLLLYTDKKVYEICREVGYKQLDWFYKKFKEYTGISTSQFRSGEIPSSACETE